MKKYRILVTGACGVTSRSVVRSLNKSKIYGGNSDFIGTDVCYNEYAIYEGLYKKVYKVPYYSDPRYRRVMQRIIDDNAIEYAILIPEPEVYYWSANPFDVKFLRIPPRTAKTCLSKWSLYAVLNKKDYIPRHQIIMRDDVAEDPGSIKLPFPLWIRDYAEGTTSGKGSLLVHNDKEAKAWMQINKNIDSFMLSEYLPGRNLACFTLFSEGRLLKYGVAQRMEYLMGKVAASGITGNTSKGKLLNCEQAAQTAVDAVLSVAATEGERMNGLVVTDMKENAAGKPCVTEINIRHVAFTSTFADAGLNFAEYQMMILEGRESEIAPEQTMTFSDDNIMLRDVDGLPIYIEHYKPLAEGECR